MNAIDRKLRSDIRRRMFRVALIETGVFAVVFCFFGMNIAVLAPVVAAAVQSVLYHVSPMYSFSTIGRYVRDDGHFLTFASLSFIIWEIPPVWTVALIGIFFWILTGMNRRNPVLSHRFPFAYTYTCTLVFAGGMYVMRTLAAAFSKFNLAQVTATQLLLFLAAAFLTVAAFAILVSIRHERIARRGWVILGVMWGVSLTCVFWALSM